jgi:two-component system, LytTR family, response regulator
MANLSCLLIEDEPLAVSILTDYIAQVPFLVLDGTFRDALLATDYLRTHTVDLLFLDIHLPKLKGIAFLKTLQNPPAVILTTAYHQYAVEGFDLNVTDYLLKPISFERFLVAVNKVPKPAPTLPDGLPNATPKDYLFVTVQKKKVKLHLADIAYIESQREYVKIVTTSATYLTKLSTHEMEALLPPDRFRRIHRSFIVAVGQISAFTAEVVEVGGVVIPIGRGYRNALEGTV